MGYRQTPSGLFIPAGAVGTTELADGAVTTAKIASQSLKDVAGLTPTLNHRIVGDGSNWAQSGNLRYVNAQDVSSTDLDDLLTPGFYNGNALTNSPDGSAQWFYIMVQQHSNTSNYVSQTAWNLTTANHGIWWRIRHNTVWQPWRRVIDTDDVLDEDNMSSDSASHVPTQQSVKAYVDASGGLVTAVESGALSSQAVLDIALGSADMYEIDLMAIAPATDAVNLRARFSQSSTFLTGAADYRWDNQSQGAQFSDLSDSFIRLGLAGDLGNSANEHSFLTLKIYRPSASAFPKAIIWYGYGVKDSAEITAINGGGSLIANNNPIDGLRIDFTSGNIASGYYAVRAYSFT